MDKKDTMTKLHPTHYEVEQPKNSKKNFNCAVEFTLDVIDGKWKAVILWHLSICKSPMRFSEIKRQLPGLNVRMLARQLRELESQGMVWRDVYPVVPPQVEYGLTKRGKTMMPIMEAMCKWANSNGWK